jgi:hypothetical protein
MRVRRCLWGVAPLALWLVSSVAAQPAPPAIPDDVFRVSGAATSTQQQSIDRYVDYWVAQLFSEDDPQVAEARQNLLDSFQRSGSPSFELAYSSSVSARLLPRLQAKEPSRTLSRVNAMIVASRLLDAKAADVVKAGLGDPSPAVRYWGAKAAAEVSRASAERSSPLPPQVVGDIVRILTEKAASETSTPVLEQELVAMVQVGSTAAIDALLRTLNSRVRLHADNPDRTTLSPEYKSFQALYKQLVANKARGDAPSRETLRALLVTGCRYLMLSTQVLDRQTTALPNRSDYIKTALLCDEVVRFAQPLLEPKLPPLASIAPNIAAEQFAEARLRTEEWKQRLVKQMGFKEEDLELPEIKLTAG